MSHVALLPMRSFLLTLVLGLSACTSSEAVQVDPGLPMGATIGQACSAELLCRAPLLCLDARCVERRWPGPPEQGPSERVQRSFEDASSGEREVHDTSGEVAESDVIDGEGEFDDAASSFPDSLDALIEPEVDLFEETSLEESSETHSPDALLEDASKLDTLDGSLEVGPAPAPEDVGPSDAEVESPISIDAEQDSSLEQDVGLGDEEADTVVLEPKKVVFLVAEDNWESGVAPPVLIPEQGQGWVTRLDAPSSGRLIAIQALMGEPFGSPSCGHYRVALWFPFGDTEFNPYPSWISQETIIVTAHDEPYVWLLNDAPEVEKGPMLLGLIVEDTCGAGLPRPALLSDTGDQGEGTWLYSVDGGGGSALVPASFFGVNGRWVLRGLIEVLLDEE